MRWELSGLGLRFSGTGGLSLYGRYCVALCISGLVLRINMVHTCTSKRILSVY